MLVPLTEQQQKEIIEAVAEAGEIQLGNLMTLRSKRIKKTRKQHSVADGTWKIMADHFRISTKKTPILNKILKHDRDTN